MQDSCTSICFLRNAHCTYFQYWILHLIPVYLTPFSHFLKIVPMSCVSKSVTSFNACASKFICPCLLPVTNEEKTTVFNIGIRLPPHRALHAMMKLLVSHVLVFGFYRRYPFQVAWTTVFLTSGNWTLSFEQQQLNKTIEQKNDSH